MTTTQTYAIIIRSEATGWENSIVAQYTAENEEAALGAYYTEHHDGEKCALGGIFKITNMTINGTRYIGMPLEWVTA